jgi:hypothetical protein
MSQFEFVMTVVSILMSFGVVRLLDGLRAALNPSRRYWVHSLWVVNRLLAYVMLWWGSWSVNDFEDWNLFLFSLWLVPFGLLYLQATALVTTHPGDIEDWRSHFYEIRPWFFAINFFFMLTLYSSTTIFGALPFAHPVGIPTAVILTVSIVGYFSASHKVQAAIAIIVFLNVFLGWGVLLFDPSTLSIDAASP